MLSLILICGLVAPGMVVTDTLTMTVYSRYVPLVDSSEALVYQSLPELTPFEYERYEGPLRKMQIGFSELWSAARSALTVYGLAGNESAWPVFMGFLIMGFLVTGIIKLLNRPPDI